MADLAYAEVAALLKYDPQTGKLWWLPRDPDANVRGRTWNTRYADREAFTARHADGHLQGLIWGKCYKAHRIAWLLFYREWPNGDVRPIDGNRANNRISNLRCIDNQTCMAK